MSKLNRLREYSILRDAITDDDDDDNDDDDEKCSRRGSRCRYRLHPKWHRYQPSYMYRARSPFKSLNTIYLASITRKAQRTYIRVLEGADVGVLWSYLVEETGEPGVNHRPWLATTPCHMPTPGFDPGSQWWQASVLTTALSRP